MNPWRAEWFDMDDATYLNAAVQAPLPRVSVRAVQQALEWKKFPHRMPDDTYFELPNRVRAAFARLIGGKAEEVAVTTGATSGLAAVADGLEWQPEDEVLIAEGEFPAQVSTFLPLAQRGTLRVKMVQPRQRFLSASDFIEQMGPNTKLVSTSLVRYENGCRIDAATLARACRDRGALLMLDVAQCAGAMPVDVATLGADFLTASGYKWLLGPFGTGFLWMRSDLIESMRRGPFYWMALESASNFHSLSSGGFQMCRGARRWDSPGTGSFLNLAPMAASLEFLLHVGVATVWAHIRKLTAGIVERLPLDRFVLASPADADQRGPFVCVKARQPELTPVMFERLREAGVIVSLRDGALRIAPHLYNAEPDLDRLLSILAV